MSDRPSGHERVRRVFDEALTRAPEARAAYVAEACAGDAALRHEVEQLLAAQAAAGSFLSTPASPSVGAGVVSLPPGTRLGQYEILGSLGAGGMGEVYRARDTKLGRQVALKILPVLFAADPDRLARFQREAQILASLNHPHIAAIYGLEDADRVRALVLELVDGPTLADRLAEGPLPITDALPLARQMATALEAAHEQGIIHRDLKPSNIKLRPDGTVKVLDFGLAKALEPTSVSSHVSQSPTITSPAMTRLGVILGTAAYMSPEQAKGRPADKRSDIWAFGCVLFELLTGQRAFGGDDIAETLAFVLTKEPDWTRLPSETPLSIRRLLRRCLEKDRSRRLADIADARLELDEGLSPGAVSEPTPVSQLARGVRLRTALLGATAGALIATMLWLVLFATRERRVVESDVFRSSILLPGQLERNTLGPNVALSPDGRHLAFIARDATGRSQLWLRALDSVAARPLPDTDGASTPFWSPDSRWLAFFANGQLKKIEASGGATVILCECAGVGGAWNRDDILLFTQRTTVALARVRAAGGETAAVTTIDASAGEGMHVSPSFLPDGRHFVYAANTTLGEARGVYVGSLDSAQRTRLPVDAPRVQYAKGFLWFVRGNTLMAQPFDPGRRTVEREAVRMAEQLRVEGVSAGVFSVSPAGAFVFQTDVSAGHELTWFDREGRRIGALGPPGDYDDLRLSPDGRRLLVTSPEAGTGNLYLWIVDVSRGLRTQFTFGDARVRRNGIWSPDSSRIVFVVQRSGHFVLVQKAASGAGAEVVLLDDEFDKILGDWSPDGRFILYNRVVGTTFPPWILPLEGDRKPFSLPQADAFGPSFSPDGHWIVYQTQRPGRPVYVAPFPGSGGPWLISTAGGGDPIWRADGKEIVYLGPDGLMSAALTVGRDHVEVGEVKPLFPFRKVSSRSAYAVSPDGQRILAVTERAEAGTEPLTLVSNWPALLKK